MSENTLRLQANVPETIALEYADGLQVASRFGGDQIMFTLTDGRKMYVAPYVADRIAQLRIGAGQPFTLCKRELTNGNRRTVEYAVELAQNGTAARLVQNHTAGVAARNNPVNDRSSSAPSQNNLPPLSDHFPERRPSAPVAANPVDGSSSVALLKMAGCGAIDAVLAIEQYAESRGLTDFSFGVENIQKFAACLFIELNKKAGRA